jgi:hypothetical protein
MPNTPALDAAQEAEAFNRVRNYVGDIGLIVTHVEPDERLLVVEDEERGIANMVIDCEDPILEIQQPVMGIPNGADTAELFEALLTLNGLLVHGAFMLSDDGTQVRFRDTLRLPTLDLAELRGTINAFHLAIEEHGDTLVSLRHALDA